MSFRPLKAQIELAWAGAPVVLPEPEPATVGVPGGPVTSPAHAPLLAPTRATANTAAARNAFIRMIASQLLVRASDWSGRCYAGGSTRQAWGTDHSTAGGSTRAHRG